MWLFLNVLCVTVQSLIKFYVILFHILYPICFSSQDTPASYSFACTYTYTDLTCMFTFLAGFMLNLGSRPEMDVQGSCLFLPHPHGDANECYIYQLLFSA